MLLQEVVLCSTVPSSNTGTGLIALHDIQTGNVVSSFKQTSAAARCTSHVDTKHGLGGIILAAQSDKALLNIFSFQRDQPISKIVLPEKLCCIAVDSRGEYCAGGTTNGRLYLWQISSGILFNSFEAHYRRISVLRFTHDGAALVSASDDSGVHVWSMSSLLDEDLQNDIPTPYCSFSEHTLPVTDVTCGVGTFPSGRVLTCSIDHSVKLWDFATRSLLTSFLLPQSITILAMDPLERAFFAASQTGSIYQVNLFRRRKDATSARSFESVGGGGMSDIVRLGEDDESTKRLISVDQPVTAMTLSMTGSYLIAGTSSGQLHIYDVASHQSLRSINTYKGKGFSITSVATLLRPPDLFGHVTIGDGGVSARDTCPVRTVASFQRTRDTSSRANHEVSMMLPITDSAPVISSFSKEELLEEHRYFVQTPGTNTSSGVPLQSRVSELEDEVADLREQLGSAKALNDSMWENIVRKVLAKDRHPNSEGEMELGERNKKRSKMTK